MGRKICIICTNDIHCALEHTPGCLGLDGAAGLVRDAKRAYGSDNVCLVDSGDALGVGALGCVSRGELPLRAMGECGYLCACPGNADLTFGLARMQELSAAAPFDFVCCNLLDAASGKPLFAPYTLHDIGGCLVAFVGVITPLAASALEASEFANPACAAQVDCCAAADGLVLYEAVQSAVDDAHAAGAQIVVLLSHLGQEGERSCFRSDALAANTHGIDLIADGHSHQVYRRYIRNAHGSDVLVVQGGLRLSWAHVVEIDLDSGYIEARAFYCDDVQTCDAMSRKIRKAARPWQDYLACPIAALPCELYACDRDGSWLVRSVETNLGDLVADAWCDALDADIALVPAWVIRANLPQGPVTMRDLLETLCLGHTIGSVQASGRAIAEALSFASAKRPHSNRYWLQVSQALSFKAGRGEVCDVLVNGQPIDPDGFYTLAGIDFMVAGGKGGFKVFASCAYATDSRIKDVEALAAYLQSLSPHEVLKLYGDPQGAGRIELLDA